MQWKVIPFFRHLVFQMLISPEHILHVSTTPWKANDTFTITGYF